MYIDMLSIVKCFKEHILLHNREDLNLFAARANDLDVPLTSAHAEHGRVLAYLVDDQYGPFRGGESTR